MSEVLEVLDCLGELPPGLIGLDHLHRLGDAGTPLERPGGSAVDTLLRPEIASEPGGGLGKLSKVRNGIVAKGAHPGEPTPASRVSSGKWAATLSATSLTFTTNANQTSTVTNTGTIALVGISYKVTVSNPASGSPTFKLFVCAVAWSGGTCSGGPGTAVGGPFPKNSTTTVNSAMAPALAGAVFLQVEPASVTSSTTVTLGTSIKSATQLRAAIHFNQ